VEVDERSDRSGSDWTDENLQKVRNLMHSARRLLARLIMWKYWMGYVKLCIEKGMNFGPMIGFSTTTMRQQARRSLSKSLWPKNRLPKWNTYRIPFIWFRMTSGSVGIALGYGLDDRVLEFDSRRELGIFLLTTAFRTALGPTQSPIQWIPGTLSLRVR
jgi:hypothetical protein